MIDQFLITQALIIWQSWGMQEATYEDYLIEKPRHVLHPDTDINSIDTNMNHKGILQA